MTPEQKRAATARQHREVEEELLHLARQKTELTPDEYNRRRVQLVNLRDQLERLLASLDDGSEEDEES
jgi:hypothetical protein